MPESRKSFLEDGKVREGSSVITALLIFISCGLLTVTVIFGCLYYKGYRNSVYGADVWNWIKFIDLCFWGLVAEGIIVWVLRVMVGKLIIFYPSFVQLTILFEYLGNGTILLIWSGLIYGFHDSVIVGLDPHDAVHISQFFLSILVTSGIFLFFSFVRFLFVVKKIYPVMGLVLDSLTQEILLLYLENVGSPVSVDWANLYVYHSETLKRIAEQPDNEENVLQVAREIIAKYNPHGVLLPSDLARVLPASKLDAILAYLNEDEDYSSVTTEELAHVILDLYDFKSDIISLMKTLLFKVDILSIIVYVGTVIAGSISCLALFIAPMFHGTFDWLQVWFSTAVLLIGVSYCWSNVFSSLFYSLYLIFVVEPFNIGDKVTFAKPSIDNKSVDYTMTKEIHTIEHIGLLTSILSHDGALVYVRNSDLVGKLIFNLNQGSYISFSHHVLSSLFL
eukprot:TRINITY_DN6601_c0_g2_i2.p1 TRINITY_DN6601_c0_g2~~TRINITY_DN6601_c0_g2_i2.p1  ORF type:complete len:449 (-),score=62.49 TRINITY_DN6601_c0_g2_i2:699-2045(-)